MLEQVKTSKDICALKLILEQIEASHTLGGAGEGGVGEMQTMATVSHQFKHLIWYGLLHAPCGCLCMVTNPCNPRLLGLQGFAQGPDSCLFYDMWFGPYFLDRGTHWSSKVCQGVFMCAVFTPPHSPPPHDHHPHSRVLT